MERHVELDQSYFTAVHTAIENVELDGDRVLRVVKSAKIDQPDENTYAKLTGSNFHNGVIEVDMRSRLLPDAPGHARGFIGIAFRINEEDSQFESFYVRPANGRTDDPVRRAHGCQYFAYPEYTFSYFRERNITQYEAPVDIGLDEWIKLRAVIEGCHGTFYINGKAVLVVDTMKHGADRRGSVGFFVDIGTEAFFKDLRIIQND